jgi:ParB-like chromosome segregation protein Spo0J
MARVQTVISPGAALSEGLPEGLPEKLPPKEILLDPETAKARPGPVAGNEAIHLEALAESMRDPMVGQLMPVIVRMVGGKALLVDGRRRREAALLIESKYQTPFPLKYVIADEGKDVVKMALHANLKSRKPTPVQFAHICAQLRLDHNWQGTRQVAEYLGVSRATVQQHDKLLSRPEAMDRGTYNSLLEQLNSGKMGAETAFFTLTRVDPAKAAKVVTDATQIAQSEATAKASARSGKAPNTRKAAPNAPRGRGDRQSASGKPSPPPKNARTTAASPPTPSPTSPAPARVTTEHVRQAARANDAVVRQTVRTLPDFDRMASDLALPGYPDPMRSFITLWFREWRRGDASDQQVIAGWKVLSALVNKQLDREFSVHKNLRPQRK